MQRIGLAVIITLGLAFAPLAMEAQESGKIYRIGYLSSGTATANAGLRQAFVDGLRDHGWIEGKNIAVEYRWAGAGKTALDVLAAELKRLPLDAMFAVNTPASLAMKRTGTTLPVVFATVSEPVAIGLVDSLSETASTPQRGRPEGDAGGGPRGFDESHCTRPWTHGLVRSGRMSGRCDRSS